MGAGILPTCIYKNKLYFLFGKEHDYCDTPGWSDFGGGTDKNETFLETAIREGGEELTGFLGSDKDFKKMLKTGIYKIEQENKGHGLYRMHIFNMNYDDALPHYYNNNQQFLQKRLDPAIIKKTKIFEKAQIKWICVDELPKMRKQFRSYFQTIVDLICSQKQDIYQFIKRKSGNKSQKNKSRKNKSRKNKSRKNKSRKNKSRKNKTQI